MFQRAGSLLAAVALATLAGCAATRGASGAAPAPSPADRRAELEAADRAWSDAAARTSAAEAIAAMLADDVRFLQDGEEIARGRTAARDLLERGPDASVEQRWTPVRADVSADGAFGYSYGFYERRAHGPETPADLRPGKYIAVWRRGEDARWRVVAYVRSPRAPGDVPLALPPAFADVVARAAASRAPGTANAREAAMDADRRFSAMAQEAGVGAAFAAFAAPDGALLGAGPALVLGPAEIGAAFSGAPAGATLVWHPVDAGASAAGDLAFTVGEAESRNPVTGAVGYSKYLTVWRRQPDGRWLYVVDGGNARPATAASGPRTGAGGR